METSNVVALSSQETTKGIAKIGTMEVMPLDNIRASIALAQSIVKELMVKDTHFGTIPGTKKPTMYKPGAQLVNTVFRCRPVYNDTVRDLAEGHREVVTACDLVHIVSGELVGQGGGSCSTMESKYRYRKTYEDTGTMVPKGYFEAVRGNKYDEADRFKPSKKHEAKKNDAGKWTWHITNGLEQNPDIADIWNTVLKMAHKRALVDATISTFGLGGIFDQDIEDLPDYLKSGAMDAEFSVMGDDQSEPPKDITPDFETAVKRSGTKYGKMTAVHEFVKACAEARKLTDQAIMQQAIDNMTSFMEGYAKWNEKRQQATAKPEPAPAQEQTAPAGSTDAEDDRFWTKEQAASVAQGESFGVSRAQIREKLGKDICDAEPAEIDKAVSLIVDGGAKE